MSAAQQRSIPACAGEPLFPQSAPQQPTVYPRVCGGTGSFVEVLAVVRGLSPRVRGNRGHPIHQTRPIRSIPACAGEPPSQAMGTSGMRVYPRVCGGTAIKAFGDEARKGLSPRVRGNLTLPRLLRNAPGSIPACAGEPIRVPCVVISISVYPRVCGGTIGIDGLESKAGGLSPRVRGNLHYTRYIRGDKRSIPACAGEPPTFVRVRNELSVYPRVCGGTNESNVRKRSFTGLSPRVRGNPVQDGGERLACGSIPACAGEPTAYTSPVHTSKVYPRVCGGTRSGRGFIRPSRGLSPRVRGNPRPSKASITKGRSIPACAGEPFASSTCQSDEEVYPRVCGGTTRRTTMPSMPMGLSPRVRGNLVGIEENKSTKGSIPACAGEPRNSGTPRSSVTVYPRVCGGTS